MKTIILGALCAALLSSCRLTIDGDLPPWNWNWAPIVWDGAAGCAWDPAQRQYVWYFEAEVDDWDGLDDILFVDANVYDERRGGRLVDAFSLEPTDEPDVWYGEWPERATYLDCDYHYYSVELVAWDAFDNYGLLTIEPNTL